MTLLANGGAPAPETPAAAAAAPAAAAPAAAAPAAAAPGSSGETDRAAATGKATFTEADVAKAMENPKFYKDGLIAGKHKSFEEFIETSLANAEKVETLGKAPEEYKFDGLKVEGLKDGVKVDPASPVAAALLPAFKKAGITQEQANTLVGEFMKYEQTQIVDPAAEMVKLGANAQAMVDNVSKHLYADAPAELKKDIEEITTTAAGIRVINHLLKGQSTGNIPSESLGNATEGPAKTSAAWGAEADAYDAKHKKSMSNPTHQQEYQRLRREQAKAQMAEEAAAAKKKL